MSVVNRLLGLVGLLAASPLLLLAWVGVRLSSPGPFLYRAQRAGKGGEPFTMYKVRTMDVQPAGGTGSVITAGKDARVFRFGALLRKLKIDELPQLMNVCRGEMLLVGPRPEDPRIVKSSYRDWQLETLDIPPGIASPGSLFNYTHFDRYVRDSHAEEDYIREFLPRKLALDAIYVRERNVVYDVWVILRTVWTILLMAVGRREFPLPPEAQQATRSFGVEF